MAINKNRKGIEVFNLTFLDVITCGFGAILLLIIITKPEPIKEVITDQQLNLTNKISAAFTLVSQLSAKLDAIKNSIPDPEDNEVQGVDSLTDINNALHQAKQTLIGLESDNEGLELVKESLERATIQVTTPTTKRAPEIGGIPVDSEYVIFIVDTSGSMHSIWDQVMDVLERILIIHPKVKGFQVMNDNGHYLIKSMKRRWIPDTPANRRNLRALLKQWNEFSNSSPVEGLEIALRTYSRKSNKISIYIFGDEFTGTSYDTVINTLNQLNVNTATKKPIVRVHSIGFVSKLGTGRYSTTSRYATLMRAVTERNRGTFLGLPIQ